ncbi:MAG TPA: hypothetical protein VIZ43_05200 [Trebonia sp.]
MNPELLYSLAAEHRRDLDAAVTARSAPAVRAGWRARPLTLPKFRVCWTHMTLAAVAGRTRGASVVIVISATRVN